MILSVILLLFVELDKKQAPKENSCWVFEGVIPGLYNLGRALFEKKIFYLLRSTSVTSV